MSPATRQERTGELAGYFRERVAAWSAQHGRVFPWRETSDPYHVIIAELMLRRTQARQVVPVYHAFLARFPGIGQLAEALEEEVSAILKPLGLAWRAAGFSLLARQLVEQTGGTIPIAREQLLALPGVGDYVASAVRCLAFGEADVLIDTNTVRVAGRYFGFSTGPESRRNREVRQAVALLVDSDQPRESNLALLDFAALVCRAPLPRCAYCPVTSQCAWYNSAGSSRPTRTGGDDGATPGSTTPGGNDE